MLLLYRLCFLPLFCLSLPYYLWRMLRRGGYRRGFFDRFGFLPALPPPAPGVRRIWLQTVSVGELLAVEPLLRAWSARPRTEVILTATTSTALRLARERFSAQARVIGFFPLDFWPCSRLAWKRLQPTLAVLMETELWPEHLHQARLRGVPVALLNARLSDSAFSRLRRFPPFARALLDPIHRFLPATPQDASRLLALGIPPGRLLPAGNLKTDFDPGPPLSPAARARLRAELGFTPTGPAQPFVLLGSSTWPGEEAFLLSVRRDLLARGVDCRLLLVPRHPERRSEILALLRAQSDPWHQRSLAPAAPPGTAITLADTLGELRRLTPAADLAFIGKTLPPHTQGQSPIEAAASGVPAVLGPGVSNFRSVVDSLAAAGGCLPAPHAAAAAAALLALATDPARRAAAGAAARAWQAASRGAADRALALLDSLAPPSPHSHIAWKR